MRVIAMSSCGLQWREKPANEQSTKRLRNIDDCHLDAKFVGWRGKIGPNAWKIARGFPWCSDSRPDGFERKHQGFLSRWSRSHLYFSGFKLSLPVIQGGMTVWPSQDRYVKLKTTQISTRSVWQINRLRFFTLKEPFRNNPIPLTTTQRLDTGGLGPLCLWASAPFRSRLAVPDSFAFWVGFRSFIEQA